MPCITTPAPQVEDKGTENFPEQGGKKLYGELTMIVTVNHDGRVLETEVVQGSGNLTAGQARQAIARAAGPFGRFSAAMRRQADQIVPWSRASSSRATRRLETNVTMTAP
jgi:protein TonB